MPFQYTFRGSDISSWAADARDLVENRDRELELYSTTIDDSFLSLNASNLTSGTVPSARMSGSYTGITTVGTLGSLTVTGNVTIDTNTLFVDASTNRVGIRTATPTVALEVDGTVDATDFRLSTKSMPRGIVALGTMSSNYTLTTSAVALNAVSWTAVADRYYRVTYFEPEAQTSTVSASTTTLQIRSGATAAGGQLSSGRITTSAAVKVQGAVTVSYVTATFAAGTQTVNASALTSSTTGTPVLVRSATSRAFLMVEDLGII